MAKLLGIPTEKLLEFVDAGFCPHWRLLDGPPLFGKIEVKTWAARNLYQRSEGRDMERLTVVNLLPAQSHDAIPPPIAALNMLCKVPEMLGGSVSAVYFLCRGGEVLYVGQTTDIQYRVASHVKEGKIPFESAFYIPTLKSSLDQVEAAFIKALKPPYNSNGGSTAVAHEQAQEIIAILTNKELEKPRETVLLSTAEPKGD